MTTAYHISRHREADAHPALSLSLHVDVEVCSATSIHVDSDKTGAV